MEKNSIPYNPPQDFSTNSNPPPPQYPPQQYPPPPPQQYPPPPQQYPPSNNFTPSQYPPNNYPQNNYPPHVYAPVPNPGFNQPGQFPNFNVSPLSYQPQGSSTGLVIINNVQPLQGIFGMTSTNTYCGYCKSNVYTRTESYVGCMVWYDVAHFCPTCSRRLGNYSPI